MDQAEQDSSTILIMTFLIMTLLIMTILITLNRGDITHNDITYNTDKCNKHLPPPPNNGPSRRIGQFSNTYNDITYN
jgi:hypothetical protein